MHPVFFCYGKYSFSDNDIYFRLTEIILKYQKPKRNNQKGCFILIPNSVFKNKNCLQANKIILEQKKRM